MGTFSNDYALPSLPIPNLYETCKLLKQSTKPLLEPSTWERTCAAIDKFSAEAGPLHDMLIRHRDAGANNSSWLRPMWDDIYMTYRGALPVDMNYCFEFAGDRWGGRSALPKLVAAMCFVVNEIRNETLPPESTKAGYLSMSPIQRLINTRIPCAVRDIWYNPPLTAPLTVAVACKGHWFIMTVINDKGELLTPSAIEDALDSIRKRAEEMGETEAVGSITTLARPEAASARDDIFKNPINRMNLVSIENCVFAVCLDDAPATEEGFGRNLLGGDSANRWFDKSAQIISEPGGRIGVNLEHSGCDAGIWVHVFSHADEAICAKKLPEGQGCAHVRLLEWDIDKNFSTRLQNIREDFARRMETMIIRQRRITSVSRELIRSKNCSPDAFVQLLYQAAYYKEKKCFRSVYEAVSARAFYQGRTECVRPVTEASAAFIKALHEGMDSDDVLLDKFRLAEKAHLDGIKRGQSALGPERHMTGLQYMYAMYANTASGKGLIKPEIFDDEGYLALRSDALSTSSITSAYIDYFGFGPVAADGLGIGYGVKSDALHMMVSSYKTSDVTADIFLDNMEEAAKRFLEIL